MPVYNNESVVGEQLDALVAQDFAAKWELVVADNGSRDGSRAIVDKYRDRLALTVVDASAVRGVSHARSVGAQAAAAPLIAYCDSDDVVAQTWLTELYAAWRPGVMVAGSLEHDSLNVADHIDSRGRVQSSELPVHMDFLPTAAACNLLLERDALEEIGGWRLDLPHGEDVDLCWRWQLSGRALVFAPKAVVHYRLRGSARQLARQIYWYNEPYPLLYRQYRDHGARRRSVTRVASSYMWVLTRLPYLFLGTRRRYIWCAVAGENAGRLAGSVRHRCLCL